MAAKRGCKYKGCDGCTPDKCPTTTFCKAYRVRGRTANPEKTKETTAKYRAAHPEKVKQYNKNFRTTHPETYKAGQKQYREKNKDRVFLVHALYNHGRRGDRIEVTADDLEEVYKNTTTCRYCGEVLDKTTHGHVRNGPSIDRINNEKVIRVDNIQFICRRCNTSKGIRPHDEFVSYANKVLARLEVV